MTEHYSFFDAVLEDDGVTYDREYNAQQFTNYFGSLITTGVMKGEKNELKVTASGSNMITKIDTGVAFIRGRYYENDNFLELTHDTESLGNNRIDRIVVRLNLNTEARYVKTFIKKGTPANNPVAPALTQTANLYEISLAQVKVVGGQTFIAANAVTDERGKDIICPWAGSNILPSFDDNALAQHIDNFELHTPYVVSTGTSLLYEVDLGPSIVSLEEGLSLAVKIHVKNGRFPQLKVNGLPEKPLANLVGSQIEAGALLKDDVYTLRYNGTFFLLQGGGILLNDTLTSTSRFDAATANAVKMVNDKVESPLINLEPIAPFNVNNATKPSVTKIGKLVVFSFGVRIGSQISANTLYQLTDSLPIGYRPKQSHVGMANVTSGNYPIVSIDAGGTVVIRPTITTGAGNIVTGCIVFETF